MRRTIIGAVVLLAIMTTVVCRMQPDIKKDGKTHLSWVVSNDPTKQVQAEIFGRLHPEYIVDIDPNNSGVTKTLIQCSAGIGGDIIDLVDERSIQVYQSAGILLDLTDLAASRGFSPDTLPEQVRQLCTVRIPDDSGRLIERQYSYPATIDVAIIIYNKAIFDRCGIPYPKTDLTWDEYIDLSRKLTVYNAPGDVVPKIFGASGVSFMTILWEKGGDFFRNQGTESGLDSPGAIAAFQFYHDLFFKYKVEPTAAIRAGVQCAGDGVIGSDSGLAWFGSGKVAMIWGARWYLKNLRTYAAQQSKIKADWEKNHPGEVWSGAELRYGACLVPRFKDSRRYNLLSTGRTVGINAKSENREGALTFLAFLAGPDYNRYIGEISGANPPNKNYWNSKVFHHPAYPEEKEIHDLSLKLSSDGRCLARSPFIETSTAMRILEKVLSEIKLKPELTPAAIAALARDAAAKTNAAIDRNIAKDRKLRLAYDRLVKR